MFQQFAGLFLILGVMLAVAAQAAPQSIKLTDKGEPLATIVVAKNPTLAAAFAARELKEHIKLITRADLPVVDDTQQVSGVRLLVGDSWEAAKLGLTSKGYKDQEYSVTFLPDAIVFLGKDKDIKAPAGELPYPDFFDTRGSMAAVYDFLYNNCGVRWYIPGDIGRCYDSKPTLTVKGDSVRRLPDMKYVWMYNVDLWMPKAADLVPRPVADLWKLRLGSGGQQFNVNHSFYGYYTRFLKDHPRWFAQGYENQAEPPQLCYTNPEVIAQVVQDARDYFDGKGLHERAVAMGDVFGLVPMDNTDYCKCENCQAELKSVSKDSENFSGGYASNYIWGFINKVAKEIKKSHPDKYVGALAYWDYAAYPTNIRLESNIAVMMCLQTRQWYMPKTREIEMNIYNSWVTKEKDRPLYLWLYFCFPALSATNGKFIAFPGYYANASIEHSEMFARDNIHGLFMEHSSEAKLSHLLDLPEIYLTMVKGRDSRIDGKKAYAEFFKKFYGNAAVPMRQLYEAIEDVYYSPKNTAPSTVWGGQNEEIAWGNLGTPENMAKFAKYMDKARNAARTDIEKQRVEYFEKGIWNYMQEGAELHKNLQTWRKQEPPKISVPRQSAGAIKGDLSKVDWSNAVVLSGWKQVTGIDTKRKISGRMTHDGEYLYVQLEEMLNPKDIITTTKGIFHDDNWDMMFAGSRQPPLRQFAVNAAGTTIGLEWPDASLAAGSYKLWESGATVQSNMEFADRWQVNMAFRLDTLVPGGVKPGTPLYANFYRTVAGVSEMLAWSPNFNANYHDVRRLGEFNLE